MAGTLSEAGLLAHGVLEAEKSPVPQGPSTSYLFAVAAKFPTTASENSATSWIHPCNSGVIGAGGHFQRQTLLDSSESAMFLASLTEPRQEE